MEESFIPPVGGKEVVNQVGVTFNAFFLPRS